MGSLNAFHILIFLINVLDLLKLKIVIFFIGELFDVFNQYIEVLSMTGPY